MNGIEVLKEARKYPETKNLKIYALTNYSNPEFNEELMKEGIDKILIKVQYTLEELILLIQEAVKIKVRNKNLIMEKEYLILLSVLVNFLIGLFIFFREKNKKIGAHFLASVLILTFWSLFLHFYNSQFGLNQSQWLKVITLLDNYFCFRTFIFYYCCFK